MKRRSFLLGPTVAPWLGLAGCDAGREGRPLVGGWVGASHERGHLLRGQTPLTKAGSTPEPAVTRRAGALVVGGGVAGLGAARALLRAGVDDVHVLELEDQAGGNSRGHAIGGQRCPLGAHYLPVPSAPAVEVIELLEEMGLRTLRNGRAVYDERTLSHSPQERLYIGGAWRDGLLPPVDALPSAERAATLAQYRGFARAVSAASADGAFAIPTRRSRWSAATAALDATPFAAWLEAQGYTAPALRWYLDYCCEDDYGAGAAFVSAWAGLHYFASRHGFRAPGDDETRPSDAGEGLLTWPDGNAPLVAHLAAPLSERLHAGRVVLRVDEGRDSVTVDAWNVGEQRVERWLAPRVVLATPLFIAARLLAAPPPALVEAAGLGQHAPWLVANLQLEAALDDRPGAPPSWDNVIYADRALGYVDAGHQALLPYSGPTVLTAYLSLGGGSPAALAANRSRLLDETWQTWAGRIVSDLATAHPDLRDKIVRTDLMRYGHGMSIPTPGVRSSAALAALAEPQRRVQFAHADLSAYSIFEEALYQGMRAGSAAAGALGVPRAARAA